MDEQLLEAATEQNIPLVKELLSKGANAAYSKKVDGVWGASTTESPIHHALLQKLNRELFKILLDAGADVNAIYAEYDSRGCGSQVNFNLELSLP